MFCPKCGTQMNDNARFCGKCGYCIAPAAPADPNVYSPPVYTAPTRPKHRKKKKSGINWTVFIILMLVGLLIIGGGVYVILAALGVIDSDLFDASSSRSSSRDKDDDEEEDEDNDEDDGADSGSSSREDGAELPGMNGQITEHTVVDLSDLEWEITDYGIELTNYTGSASYVVLPDTIEGKKVVSLGNAFAGNVAVETLVLGEYVTNLNFKWINTCENLIRLEGPGVEHLAYDLFNDSLEELILPKLEYLKLDSIKSGDGLRYLEIPNVQFIKAMDDGVVDSWPESLEQVVIPEDLYYRIGDEFDDEDLEQYFSPVGALAVESYLDWDEEDYEELNCAYSYYSVEDENADYVFCYFFQKRTIVVNNVRYEIEIGEP